MLLESLLNEWTSVYHNIAPLSELTRKMATQSCRKTNTSRLLNSLKDTLTSDPVLASPNCDKPFVVQMGASDVGIGAVLS